MASPAPSDPTPSGEDMNRLAEQSSPGFFAEFWYFLVHNKKWWLAPILIVLLLVGLFVMLSGTAIAPFIYPMF